MRSKCEHGSRYLSGLRGAISTTSPICIPLTLRKQLFCIATVAPQGEGGNEHLTRELKMRGKTMDAVTVQR